MTEDNDNIINDTLVFFHPYRLMMTDNTVRYGRYVGYAHNTFLEFYDTDVETSFYVNKASVKFIDDDDDDESDDDQETVEPDPEPGGGEALSIPVFVAGSDRRQTVNISVGS